MDNGLVLKQYEPSQCNGNYQVLILVIVEDGLVLNGDISKWDVSKVS